MGVSQSCCVQSKSLGGDCIIELENGLAPGMHFAMWTMPISTFLAMNGVPANHNELIVEGKILTWAPGMFCVFVSHQWLSDAHPDPEGKQVKVLQQGLGSIMSGETSVGNDMVSFIGSFGDENLMDQITRNQISQGYLWFDWFSIPQLDDKSLPKGTHCASGSLETDMHKAVMSIPAYVECSDLFIVLAPALVHRDTCLLCDFGTWRKRGWCRLELVCRVLSKRTTSVICMQSPVDVEYMLPFYWVQAPVSAGDFTVQADVRVVQPVLETVFGKKILSEREHGQTGVASFFIALRERERIICQELSGLGTVFAPNSDATYLGDVGASGFTPLMAATIMGNVEEIRRLLVGTCDVNQRLEQAHHSLCLYAGSTALHLAPRCGNTQVVEVLLHARADLEAEDEFAVTPIQTAAVATVPIVERLLDFRADINSSNIGGAHILGQWFGVRASDIEVLRTLLKRRVDVNKADQLGHQSLHVAASFGGKGVHAQLLLDAMAELDCQASPHGLCGHALTKSSRLAVMMGSTGKATKYFGELAGCTPLMLAAFTNNIEMCDFLLAARANPMLHNSRGHTAYDLALQMRADTLANDLATRTSEYTRRPV